MHKSRIWTGVIVVVLVVGLAAAAGLLGSNSIFPVIAANAQTLGSQPAGDLQTAQVHSESPLQSIDLNSGTLQPQGVVTSTPGSGWNSYGMGWGMMGGYNWNGYGLGPGMMGGYGWNGYGMGSGMMGGYGRNGYGMGPGMMGGYGWNRSGVNPSGQRISLDQAVNFAKQYALNYGSKLAVTEVMEFSSNFYAVVSETNSGRGAFELLVEPYSGRVSPEMGPNMMWNFKYGMMGSQAGDNTLTLEQARQLAQQALDANMPGAKVEPDGIAFYGHYTFDYKVNGQIAGMLSVNGVIGAVWPHTWHGTFIAETQVTP